VGDIEKDGNTLVVKRIHVTYHLRLAPDQREDAQRVLGLHADFCPVARSIRDSIEITTSVEMEDAE
jgi:organic hydroperoxide reductase OsmC/OhrA